MNPYKYLLILLFLLPGFSCRQKEPSVHDLAKEAPASARDTILVNNDGDTIRSGMPITLTGRKIALESVKKRQHRGGLPRKLALSRNTQKIPQQLSIHPIRLESLKSGTSGEPSVNNPVSDKVEASLPTGIPIPAKGEVIPCLQPNPSAASLPIFRDNATHDIKYLDEGQGMNSSRVNAMLEDSRGHLWFGTHGGGLSKYDGARFTHYTSNENLLDDILTSVLKDKNGNLWFGTWTSGLCMFDGTNFTNYSLNSGLINDEIRTIFEDRAGNIWLGTLRGGLCKYDGENFIHYTTKEGLSSNTVLAIQEDHQGDLWIGTGNGGVNKFDGKDFYTITTREGLGNNTVLAILEDHQGNLWFGTNGGGIHKFDGVNLTQFSTRDGLNDNVILSLYEDDEGLLWIGTESGGVNVFDGDSFAYLTMEEGLSDNTITTIVEDDKGGLWFGTRDGGVNIYKHHSFVSVPDLAALNGDNVRSILEDSAGDFWLATWGGGIIKYDGEYLYQYTSREGIGDNTVWALLEDRRGDLWFGTQFAGLGRYDGEYFTNFLEFPGLAQFGIWSMLEDSKGNIWLGTDGAGILKYDGEFFTQYSIEQGFSADRVWSIMERNNGEIWFATWGGGAVVFDGQDFTFYTEKEGLVSNDVWSIVEDNNGNLWFGTYGGGLCVYNGKDFFKITTFNGLPSNIVNSIIQDKEQNIWLGTEKGLAQIVMDPGQLFETPKSNYLDPSLFKIIVYSTSDGLKAQDFNVHGSLLDSRNVFWMGTGKGLLTLDLNHFEISENIPSLYLDYLEVNGQFVDYPNLSDTLSKKIIHDGVAPFTNLPLNLQLSPDKNHLTFHFSALDYAEQHDIQYSYKIAGLNEYWSNPSPEAKADYKNIPFGHYTFLVRARGKSEVWSKAIAYTFIINPPWWKTWWAYTLYSTAGLLVLGGLYFYQRRQWQLQTRWQLEWERAERLKEVDQLKSRFYTNITHEFRTPLTVIKGMADEILEPANIKTLIHRNAERLLRMVNQLLDLSKLESNNLSINWIQADIIIYLQYLTESCHSLAERQQLNLAFFSKEDELIMDFDENILQQILVNLLSNAIKFTPVYGNVKVIAAKVQEDRQAYLKLIVKDTGKGIPADKLPYIFDRFYQADDSATRGKEGSGIGLALVKELVQLLEGRIEVDSEEGKGTCFRVYLPIHCRAKRIEEQPDQIFVRTSSLSAEVPNNETVAATSSNGTDQPLILVIEDNSDVREYIFSCLKMNYALAAARDGKEGLEMAQDMIPDIVLCDVMMPEMDGFEVCRHLKTDNRTSHIPVILLTAKATQEDKVTGLSQGADAYLTKPFDKKELLVRLSNLVAQSQRLQRRLTDPTFTDEEPTALEKREAAFLGEVNQIIEANLENDLFKIEYLCKAIAMSRAQLYRKLKALTGQSTAKYIRLIRLNKARDLLEKSDLPIGEVALRVGYKDFSHFSRSFLKEFGIQPSGMRGG